MSRERDTKIRRCMNKSIDLHTCGVLVDAIDHLDTQQNWIWNRHDEIKNLSEPLYDKLNKAYESIETAKDWLRDIIGDVD